MVVELCIISFAMTGAEREGVLALSSGVIASAESEPVSYQQLYLLNWCDLCTWIIAPTVDVFMHVCVCLMQDVPFSRVFAYQKPETAVVS